MCRGYDIQEVFMLVLMITSQWWWNPCFESCKVPMVNRERERLFWILTMKLFSKVQPIGKCEILYINDVCFWARSLVKIYNMIYTSDSIFEACFLIGRHSFFLVIFQNLNLLVLDGFTTDFSDIVFLVEWMLGVPCLE